MGGGIGDGGNGSEDLNLTTVYDVSFLGEGGREGGRERSELSWERKGNEREGGREGMREGREGREGGRGGRMVLRPWTGLWVRGKAGGKEGGREGGREGRRAYLRVLCVESSFVDVGVVAENVAHAGAVEDEVTLEPFFGETALFAQPALEREGRREGRREGGREGGREGSIRVICA